MDSSIVSGLFGGLVSFILCFYISKRVRNKSEDGELKYGFFIVSLFIVSLVIVLGCLYALFFTEIDYERDVLPIICIIILFGFSTIYSFGEAFRVKGNFNDSGIEFHTPWTGTKKENWENLKFAKFNAGCSWYTLTFKSGAVIRLSSFLSGHGLVVDLLKSKGHDL